MVSPTKKYTRQGQYGSDETDYTTPNMQGTPSSAPEPPGPMSERDASLDARIRLKQDRHMTGGEADTATGDLDAEERAFLARMPADSEVPPERYQAPRKPVADSPRGGHEQLAGSSREHVTRRFATNAVPKDEQEES